MNYLAHLHIADHCQSSLTGNLLGDFVRGNPEGRWSKPLVSGIKLHRFVDSHTDHHPLVLQAKQFFDQRTRRFSGIALDVFWDHCLAIHWRKYHEDSLYSFTHQAGKCLLDTQQKDFPQAYQAMVARMVEGRWLVSYQELENIHFALNRISQRRPKFEPVAECSIVLDRHYVELIQIFHRFYPQLLSACTSYVAEQSL